MDYQDQIISIVDKTSEEISSTILSGFVQQSKTWLHGDAYVNKKNIYPELIAPALPNIAIIERLNEGDKRFFIRLSGEEITNRTLGFKAKSFIEDVTPDFYSSSLIEQYGQAIDEGNLRIQDIIWDYDYRKLHIERVLLPIIINGGDKPDGLLLATVRASDTLRYMMDNPTFEEAS